MPVRGSISRRFVLLLVGFLSFSLINATPGFGGPMGGGGTSGGGGAGGGSSGKRSGAKEPPKKRNERTVDPAAAREKLVNSLERALMAGTASTPFLMNLFDQASIGDLPASATSRKALAEAISNSFKGKKLSSEQAKALAGPIGAGITIDGISPDDLAATKSALSDGLASTDASDEQKSAIISAYEKVQADQQDVTIKSMSLSFEALQAEGAAGDEQKKMLSEGLGALASGETKPDEASLAKLSDHLAKALDNAQLTNKEKAQIAHDLVTIFNSAEIPPAQFHPTLNEVKTILKAASVPAPDVQLVAADLQSIYQAMKSKK